MNIFDHAPHPDRHRLVAVKGTSGLWEVGVGTIDAALLWESDPDAAGAFTHLTRTADDTFWLSITDMEEASGSYISVAVTADDLTRLAIRLQLLGLTP